MGCQSASSPSASPEVQRITHELQESYRNGNRPYALALSDSLIHIAPASPTGYLWKGILLREIGQLQEAAHMFELAHQRAPQQAEPLLLLGRVRQQQGRFAEALTHYRRAIQHASSTLQAAGWLQMGYTYHEQGMRDSARYAFTHALAVDSTLAEAWDGLRLLWEEEGRTRQALTAIQRAIRINPGELNYYLIRGRLLLQQGDYETAIQDFQRVLSQRPWHQEAHYALSRAYQSLGDTMQARKHRTIATSLQELQPLLTQAEVEAREHPQALALLKLARRLLQEGRARATREALEAVRTVLPGNKPVEEVINRMKQLMSDE